jgi:hypothetical protein
MEGSALKMRDLSLEELQKKAQEHSLSAQKYYHENQRSALKRATVHKKK